MVDIRVYAETRASAIGSSLSSVSLGTPPAGQTEEYVALDNWVIQDYSAGK